ncbi:Zinc finger protein [Wickerhamomyces ciferrii]|uniref:Zinc finger protein n=1 Tax=Wickerhamomyces ciferrii (strain ATCC 14091 / BCRC 22168 / CBS 111 / JCM 3599 / NBRC 0793 / NRRL Y-1031 F-60-10) TaxID=1206466 RepID=K0KRN8_WICCF|nr:Zinc finger protein [Wickerhamomyces ciferrii]CCH43984.1 Zinc finger protein [Wickerhamomyces ciferrii]
MSATTESHISLFGYINSLYHYVCNLKILNGVLPSKNITRKQDSTKQSNKSLKSNKESKNDDTIDLFPKSLQYNELNSTQIKPCSMEVNKLNKIINSDGSISWEINHDANNNNDHNLTSPFLTSTGSTISSHDELSPKFLGQTNTPSPFNINNQHKHNEIDSRSNSNIEQEHDHDHDHEEDNDSNSNHSLDLIPDLPHPDFFDIKSNSSQEIDTPQSTTTSPQSTTTTSSTTNNNGKKVYVCEYCNSEFRIKGYLTRHIKKHAINKAYECPFFNPKSENKCHPNGGFSRRDTYKTHLKARHFKYPQGTRSQDRSNTPGKCGMCFKPYKSNEDWVENHIENGECESLPKGYEGRVKNSRRRNYEFPNVNESQQGSIKEQQQHKDSSSVEDFNEDESPRSRNLSNSNSIPPISTTNTSPILSNTTTTNTNTNNTNPLTQPTALDLGFGKANYQHPVWVNEYDNNDEFSLDTEQVFYRW